MNTQMTRREFLEAVRAAAPYLALTYRFSLSSLGLSSLPLTLSSIAPITPVSILTVVNPSHDVSHLRYVGRSGPEEAIETIAESGQTIAVDRVIGPLAHPAVLHQSRTLELGQVDGNRRLSQADSLDDLADTEFLPALKELKHLQPGLIRDGLQLVEKAP